MATVRGPFLAQITGHLRSRPAVFFDGVGPHDAGAAYHTYIDAVQASGIACALRELQAYADHHQTRQQYDTLYWVDQAAFALLTLHRAAERTPGKPIDPMMVVAQRRLIRLGILTADHPEGKLGNKHSALARRLDRRVDDYLQFAANSAIPSSRTLPNRRFAWLKSGRRSLAPCAPSPAPIILPPHAPTHKPLTNAASGAQRREPHLTSCDCPTGTG